MNQACFNSTMVRLKGSLPGKRQRDVGRFNSTMVRLKGVTMRGKENEPSMFQFHNGSIKSIQELRATEGEESFNSTMVRLKAEHCLPAYITEREVSIPQWFD